MIDRDDESRLMSPALYLARRAARHYGLFLVALALGLGATAAVVRHTDQVYRSETVLLYRNTRDGSGDDSSRRAASRLQDMLMSRERLARVIRERSLFPKVDSRDEAADEMKKRIAFRVRDGNTFLISYDAGSPALAQAVAARLATTLIDDNARLRRQEAQETGRFLEQERARLDRDVRAKEDALTAFLATHPEALGRGAGEGPETPALDGLEQQLARLQGVPVGDDRPDPEVMAAVRRAETEFDVAQKDYEEKAGRLTEAHPDLLAARAKMNRAETNLQRVREAAGLTRPPTTRSTERGQQVAAIEREMARLRRARPGRVPRTSKRELEASVMFESLRHELEQARARLASLEDRQFQAGLAAKLETSSELGQLSVLDPASRPGLPFLDVRKKVTIGGAIGALLLALLAAALRARADDRLHDRLDVEWLTGRPVLVSLPPPPRTRRRLAHG